MPTKIVLNRRYMDPEPSDVTISYEVYIVTKVVIISKMKSRPNIMRWKN